MNIQTMKPTMEAPTGCIKLDDVRLSFSIMTDEDNLAQAQMLRHQLPGAGIVIDDTSPIPNMNNRHPIATHHCVIKGGYHVCDDFADFMVYIVQQLPRHIIIPMSGIHGNHIQPSHQLDCFMCPVFPVEPDYAPQIVHLSPSLVAVPGMDNNYIGDTSVWDIDWDKALQLYRGE